MVAVTMVRMMEDTTVEAMMEETVGEVDVDDMSTV